MALPQRINDVQEAIEELAPRLDPSVRVLPSWKTVLTSAAFGGVVRHINDTWLQEEPRSFSFTPGMTVDDLMLQIYPTK